MNMLGLAKRCRARFLISSTSEVYGDPLQHPQVGRPPSLPAPHSPRTPALKADQTRPEGLGAGRTH
jgi:nucleoside-diphosphate-sugar epimerase